MKFYATLNVNGGQTVLTKPLEFQSKTKAISEIKARLEAIPGHDNSVWSVTDESGVKVAEGGYENGKKFDNQPKDN